MSAGDVEGFAIDPTKVRAWKRYPAYKDSGVEWLGEVPGHWQIKRIKQLLKEMIGGGTPESGNTNYYSDSSNGTPWVTIADISNCENISSTFNYLTTEGLKSKNLKVLPVGTILYSIYASLGKVATLNVPATTNQAILGLIPWESKIDKRFFTYWLKAQREEIIRFSSSNTQSNLNAEKIRNLPILLPPLPEQHAIAAFLDRETARLDALIEKKQRFIELLEEKR